jgi:hypothetical protein
MRRLRGFKCAFAPAWDFDVIRFFLLNGLLHVYQIIKFLQKHNMFN